jgi:hypothetical protein
MLVEFQESSKDHLIIKCKRVKLIKFQFEARSTQTQKHTENLVVSQDYLLSSKKDEIFN